MYPIKKLWEICIIERWWSPRPIESFITNDENWINWIKIWDTKNISKYIERTAEKIKPEWVKRSRMVYPWDFILSNSMSFWKPFIMKTTWCIHDWWLVLRTDKNIIDDNLLYLLLGSDLMYLKFSNASSWTTVKNLSIDKVKNIPIPLPPLPTQKLIVQKLDLSFQNINKQIDLIKKNLSSLEELNKSVLEKVFSEWFNEYKLKKIFEIAYVKSWKRLLKWEKVLDKKTDFPYIRVSDFWDNWTIDLSNIKYISEEVYKSISNYIITDEDLYISIAWTIWKTWIIPKELNWANLTENAVRLVYKNKSEIFNNYIYYFTISENFKKQAWLATRAVAMPKLAITRLKEIQIPLPPLPKQKEIVSYLDEVFEKNKELKTKYELQLKQLEELKQSLLKDAFEGRLIS